MARLNISIPDGLYERLDRQRDRVNASKVCATALQKELDMIEGRTAVPTGDSVARLVQRLRGKRDIWYRRGRHDGEAWAADLAGLEELREIGEDWEDDGEYDVDDDELPRSFQWRGHVWAWILADTWEPGAWDRLRQHLAGALEAPEASVRLGLRERYYLLKQLGYAVSETRPPDQGPASAEASKKFMSENGLGATESLGPRGWAALVSAYGPRLELPAVSGAAMEASFAEFQQQELRWHYLRGWHHGARDLWRTAREQLDGHDEEEDD